ncbi:hypothetical protein [Secundilactobacillus malefermentans]|uniref:hypothetical protein n=1 Tax=Secundilactobacillus malefermentans TaxID=176292 RepID=UPI0011CB2D26|nr:hypothetical protein [Secundilactobacillus malefermentans]QEA32126.1 hypothetical protein FGL90_07985 [Secundilactobacillus malefermentans]
MKFEPIYRKAWNYQRSKFFLCRWYEYDQYINDLTTLDKACVIELYTRLSYLTNEERLFLANHYHHPRQEILTDAEQASRLGIETKEYASKRREVIAKLSRHREHPDESNDFMKQIEQLLAQV